MRAITKRVDELSAWDLDKGCRHIVNQSTPSNRRLKKVLRKKSRKQLDNYFQKYYNNNERSESCE